MSTIAQNRELLKQLWQLIEAHRGVFRQERVYQRAVALLFAELFSFSRHTITQLLMALGLTEMDWSSWYRLFSGGRFDAVRASEVLFAETLAHVGREEVYVVAGDGTQTGRSSGKMEGVGWIRQPGTAPFRVGLHQAQRWFHGSWLLPAEQGYSRALPLKWLPAFTEKARRQLHEACKEWEAAVQFFTWMRQQFQQHGREEQELLAVVDGSYETLELWKHLPEGVILF